MELSKELSVSDFTETIKCYIVHVGYMVVKSSQYQICLINYILFNMVKHYTCLSRLLFFFNYVIVSESKENLKSGKRRK